MIRFLYGDQIATFPHLAETMFRDRAQQFNDRLKWQVTVDAAGLERDQYDALNPLYVIHERPDGTHGGSMRFLPTTGRTMVNEHFRHLSGGGTITSPLIWECTRFCLSPNLRPGGKTSAKLMLAAAGMGRMFHLAHSVGVFDTRMIRVYKTLGWAPEVIGTDDDSAIAVGLWDFDAAPIETLCTKAGLEPNTPRRWADPFFGPQRRRSGQAPLAELTAAL